MSQYFFFFGTSCQTGKILSVVFSIGTRICGSWTLCIILSENDWQMFYSLNSSCTRFSCWRMFVADIMCSWRSSSFFSSRPSKKPKKYNLKRKKNKFYFKQDVTILHFASTFFSSLSDLNICLDRLFLAE